MNITHKWWLGGLASGLLVGALASHAAGLDAHVQDQDRPAMIVKRGSVHFELQPLRGRAKSPDWVADGNGRWKSDRRNGNGLTRFTVAVTQSAGGTCEDMNGPRVQFMSGARGERMTLMIVNGEFRLSSRDPLTANNNRPQSRLSAPTMNWFSEVKVAGNTCRLTDNSEVWIWEDE